MNKEPLVVAIVLNWNGMTINYNKKPILKLCLESLNKVKYQNLKLIVADAESSDDSLNYVKTKFKKFKIFKTKNKGYAYSNNRAIEYAFKIYPNLDYILLLNDDLIFEDDLCLPKLINAAEKTKNIGIVGCKLLYPDNKIQHSGLYLSAFGTLQKYKNPKKSKKVYAVIGAVFLIKRNVLETIGLFDETYLPFYHEEIDFCERAKKNNYFTFYIGNTKIIHLESASIGSKQIKNSFNRKDKDYSLHRNKFIFMLRYHKFKFISLSLLYLVWIFINPNPLYVRSRKEISYRIKIIIPAFINALKTYKIRKISFITKIRI